MEGPNGPNEARRRGVPRGVGSGEERRSPSPENFVLTVQICSFFPRFQDRDSISVRDLHCILLLYITHSSKVNCTLDKVTFCQKTHNFRPWIYDLPAVLVKHRRRIVFYRCFFHWIISDFQIYVNGCLRNFCVHQ